MSDLEPRRGFACLRLPRLPLGDDIAEPGVIFY
jgi:hypothetical protein